MAVPVELVLVDLDETLAPTEFLRAERHNRIAVSLSDVADYSSLTLHAGMREALDDLQRDYSVGLVTSSPRWYVDQLLTSQLHDFQFVVTITYDDVANIKPHPEPLLLALSQLGVAARAAVYIGDDLVDQQAAVSAGVAFLGAGWADSPTFPLDSVVVAHPSKLVGHVREACP